MYTYLLLGSPVNVCVCVAVAEAGCLLAYCYAGNSLFLAKLLRYWQWRFIINGTVIEIYTFGERRCICRCTCMFGAREPE